MAYSQFTLKEVKHKFNLQIVEDHHLFLPAEIPPVTLSDYLKITLTEFLPLALAINTEKSRSEWIIAPILAELRRQLNNQISLFSGTTFTIDEEKGLDGKCDYIISLNPEQFYITAPIITIVEAKKEDLVQGFGQCMRLIFSIYKKHVP